MVKLKLSRNIKRTFHDEKKNLPNSRAILLFQRLFEVWICIFRKWFLNLKFTFKWLIDWSKYIVKCLNPVESEELWINPIASGRVILNVTARWDSDKIRDWSKPENAGLLNLFNLSPSESFPLDWLFLFLRSTDYYVSFVSRERISIIWMRDNEYLQSNKRTSERERVKMVSILIVFL
jgi:hypothetical protein